MAAAPLSGPVDVVVAGAGTAGLATALFLGRAGHTVAVLERRTKATAPPRGEIIQPNGLEILHRLGVLDKLRAYPHAQTTRYHFCRIGRGVLATFDYTELAHPHPTTLVLTPEVLNACLRDALAEHPNVTLHHGAQVTGLLREDGRVCGVRGTQSPSGEAFVVSARLVAGADGAASRVRREMGVGRNTSPYGEGYLTGFLPRPAGFGEDGDGYYYMGKGEILGLFAVSRESLYFFYLSETDQLSRLRRRGVEWLGRRIAEIHPPAAAAAARIGPWEDLNFFPCVRAMAPRWQVPGAALVGDAAHSVNPHTAQGRNLALMDAAALYDAVSAPLSQGGALPGTTLTGYERARLPEAMALQRLGDELVLFWNARNPLLTTLRDRAFRGLAHMPGPRMRVMRGIAGLSTTPLGPGDRLRLTLGF
ncbi:MAG: FAD-dependent oxidoreductase [Leptospirillia bacterium]